MSHPRSHLSILLCLSMFIGTIYSASLPPPSIGTNNNHEQKFYSPGQPSSNIPPYWLGLRITEYSSSTIVGQAVLGTLVGAMTNISLSPREEPIRSEYNFTLESGTSPSYNATIGFKVNNQTALPPPFQLTNERLLVALGLLASVYSSQDDLNNLWECAVDITVLVPSQGDLARVIAQGGLYVLPAPLVRLGSGDGSGSPTEA